MQSTRERTSKYAARRNQEGFKQYKRYLPPELFAKADKLLKPIIEKWRKENGHI